MAATETKLKSVVYFATGMMVGAAVKSAWPVSILFFVLGLLFSLLVYFWATRPEPVDRIRLRHEGPRGF